ncbi:MAG: hypothetical protein ACOZIN_04665 [Myxococcota bacterium]
MDFSRYRMGPDAEPRQIAALTEERMLKMMVRVLGGLYCGLPRDGTPGSVMQPSIMGPDDLDGIDLSNWRRQYAI